MRKKNPPARLFRPKRLFGTLEYSRAGYSGARTVYDAVPHHSGGCQKTELRVHTVSLKREYCWKLVVWLQSSILHPKNTKIGKSDVFKSLKIA